MFVVGMRPGEVYTEARQSKGFCPLPGTRFNDGQGRMFVLLKVGASQNLTNGLAVTFRDGLFTTVLGTAATAGVPNVGAVAIVNCSMTASTSTLVWAQIYGLCNFAVFEASGSALPGAVCRFGADGKLTALTPGTTSASHATFYLAGLNCAATNSVINSPVGSVFLNFPVATGF